MGLWDMIRWNSDGRELGTPRRNVMATAGRPVPWTRQLQSYPDFKADRISGRTGFQAAPDFKAAPDFIDGGRGPTGYNQIRERPP